MDHSKVIVTIITILIVFVALPVGIYNYYFNYQNNQFTALEDKDYEAYTTEDGTYSVELKDPATFGGSEDTTSLKIYVVDNETQEYQYICSKSINYRSTEISFLEDSSEGCVVTVIFEGSDDSDSIEIDCVEKKRADKKFFGLF
ncbi:MAG: hypothetical protein LUE12_07395 [Ruminococcus sp.]|nr:hypothetical protein [Ruminococcus sp.]